MTRVYAIHTGSYSDQGWGPVFSTVEKALEYVAQHSTDDERIETYILDEENDTGPMYPSWRLIFDREGDVLFSEYGDAIPYEPQLHGKTMVKLVPKDNHWYMLDKVVPRSRGHLLVWNIYAPDLEHAVKIAADARRLFLASQV